MDDNLHLWSYFYPISITLPVGLRLGNKAVDFLVLNIPIKGPSKVG